MSIFSLALKSLFSRKLTLFLTLFSIAISVTLLLGVQVLKEESKKSFMSSASGSDLIVGPRSSSIDLLLYSVFHIGRATNLITLESYNKISTMDSVKWALPVSMGDSHKGFSVMATSSTIYEYYTYGKNQHLDFSEGKKPKDMFDVVLGSDVSKKLNYKIGDKIIMEHGKGEIEHEHHDAMPYVVSSILRATHTPLDQSLIISLEGMEAMHMDEELTLSEVTPKVARAMKLLPENINFVFVALKDKSSILSVQRLINSESREPLSAIIPAVALVELWEFFSMAQNALDIVAGFVVVVGLLGMLSIVLMSLSERRREMAILRSVGASAKDIFLLIVGEAAFVAFMGIILGVIFLYLLMATLQVPLALEFGFYLSLSMLSLENIILLLVIELGAVVISFIPAYQIYYYSLSDGMSIKF